MAQKDVSGLAARAAYKDINVGHILRIRIGGVWIDTTIHLLDERLLDVII